MGYLLAIDAGTGSARAVVFDEGGAQLGVGQEEWTHAAEEGVAGAMNFDTQSGWALICRCVKKAIETSCVKADDISVVTATSMREGIVLHDKFGAEIWAVANVDSRAGVEVANMKKEFAGVEEEFYAKSGQTFALGALPRLMWLKNNRPDVYDKVAYLTMIDSWVLYRLSGVFAADPSNGGTTGVFDLKTRNWATDMASKVGLKSDIFPPIFESGQDNRRGDAKSGGGVRLIRQNACGNGRRRCADGFGGTWRGARKRVRRAWRHVLATGDKYQKRSG